MRRPLVYTPKNHKRRAAIVAALDNIIYDARHAPRGFWAVVGFLAGFAALFLLSCAQRHAAVSAEDRAGVRTYEAP